MAVSLPWMRKNHIVSVNGEAIITTSAGMFGGSALYVPGVANRDFVAVEDAPDLWMEHQAFTVEMFIKRQGAQATGIAGLYYQRNSSNFVLCLYNNCLVFWSGGWKVLSSTVVPDNVTTHIALVRDEALNLYLLQDGKVVGTSAGPDSDYYGQNAGKTYVGGDDDLGFNQPFKGWIDEVRVTKSVARYTQDGPAPVGPFSGTR